MTHARVYSAAELMLAVWIAKQKRQCLSELAGLRQARKQGRISDRPARGGLPANRGNE
jgi:hypothetical protein